MTGVSDALTHSTSVSLAVETPDYLVFAAPSSRTVAPGGSTTYNISTAASGGFAGTVALTVEGLPAGATATFSPATIAAGAGTSTLTVTLPSAVAAGETTLTIQGASGPLVRNAFVTLSVSAASLTSAFAVPTGAQSLPALGTSDWAHWGVSAATSYTHKAAVTPLISNVTLVGGGSAQRYTNNPVGFSWTDGTPAAAATNTTTGIYVAGINRGFRLTVPADTTPRTLTLFVGVWREQGRLLAQLSDQSAPDFTDTSLINATGTSVRRYTLSYRAASAGQTLTVTFTQMGTTGNVTLQAAALAAAAAAADFGLTATPATRTVTAGAETTAAIATAPINGFSGNVALSVTGLPAGATASFAPASISGGSGASTLTVATTADTPAGTFPLTVTGTSGALTHTAPVTLVVQRPDFTLTATPATRTVVAGAPAAFTVSAGPVDGFTGAVALSVTGLPAGTTASFAPASISGGSGASTLTVATTAGTPAGTFPLTVTGTSAALTHTAPLTLVVERSDFTLTATPATRTVVAGTPAAFTVSASPVDGFTGAVALSVTGLPAGTTASFAPASISGGSGASTLTVATTAGTPAGTFPLTVTGTSGALTHTAPVTLVVQRPDFTLTATPATRTVVAGAPAAFTVSAGAGRRLHRRRARSASPGCRPARPPPSRPPASAAGPAPRR